jgi:hypothetical protein
MVSRLHGCKASLDSFADHQYLARMSETYRSAPTRAEHIQPGSPIFQGLFRIHG